MFWKHGDTDTPEWRAWRAMRKRCTLKSSHKDYKSYNGRGIAIDPRWGDYLHFLVDMGRKPSPYHTLERKDNDGPYCKDNCKWATRKEQTRNRRVTVLSRTLAGRIRQQYSRGPLTMEQLATKYGITRQHVADVIHNRIWDTL